MKKLLLLITIISLISCSKEIEPVKELAKPYQPKGVLMVHNPTQEAWRVVLWRYNSGGDNSTHYEVSPNTTLKTDSLIAGKYILGFIKLSGRQQDWGFDIQIMENAITETTVF